MIAAVIRPALTDDVDEIARVFLAARLKMEAEGIVPFVHPHHTLVPYLKGVMRHGPVFVAIWQGRIGAILALTQGWLDHLYVEPAAQGNGLGTALLKTAMRSPEAAAGLELWCFQGNAGARRFYEAHGFTTAEFTDGANNDEKTADVRYVWRPQSR